MSGPMTKGQAEQKWCPFARVREWNSAHAFNRSVKSTGEVYITGSRCITDRCMAWKTPANEEKGFCALISLK